MKILLAGPGTGKTTKISSLIDEKTNARNILILSFTNATVNDLIRDLSAKGISGDNCMTLHKFAVKYNHDKFRHILNRFETEKLEYIATGTEVSFEQLCDFLSCTTFDQMIKRFVSYAKHNKVYLKEKLEDFTTIIVDEYQDFNPTEQSLIDLLIEEIPDSYILGDDDQCIYDFKDASTDKIIELHKTHEAIKHDHICYRCPDKIIRHATNLIKNNSKRINKDWNVSGKSGELKYIQFITQDAVAEYVIKEIQKIISESPDDKVLILSPMRFATREIVEKMEDLNIKHSNYCVDTIPDSLVIESWKLKSIFGEYKYLNLLLLGYKLSTNRKKLYELIKNHLAKGQNISELYNFLHSKLPPEVTSTYSSIEEVLSKPEFSELLVLYDRAEGNNQEEKLEALFKLSEKEDGENIKLMSIHKSKGLGADHIFMIGLTEGIIPNKKRGIDTIESQRRLFYVGMTRTKKNLHLLSAVAIEGRDARKANFSDFKYNVGTRVFNGRASRFIEELGL